MATIDQQQAQKLGLECEKKLQIAKNPMNPFLSVLFDEEELDIWDYNRVIKDLNGYNPTDFLHAIAEHFDITPLEEAYKPQEKYSYGMMLGNQWYRIDLKQTHDVGQGIESLDIQVLSDLVLNPILGIKDQRTDPRIDFVGGIRGMDGLSKRVKSGQWELAFLFIL